MRGEMTPFLTHAACDSKIDIACFKQPPGPKDAMAIPHVVPLLPALSAIPLRVTVRALTPDARAGLLALLLIAGMVACTKADVVTITAAASPADPATATFTVNCPADGNFNNQFVVYFGADLQGAPVNGLAPQAASPPVRCVGISTVSHSYAQQGTFQVGGLTRTGAITLRCMAPTASMHHTLILVQSRQDGHHASCLTPADTMAL